MRSKVYNRRGLGLKLAMFLVAWAALGAHGAHGQPIQSQAAAEVLSARKLVESAVGNPAQLKEALNGLALAGKTAAKLADTRERARIHSALGLLYSTVLWPVIGSETDITPDRIIELARNQFHAAILDASEVSTQAEADASFFAGVGYHLIRNQFLAAGDPDAASAAHKESLRFLNGAVMKGASIKDARPLYIALRDQGEITPVAWVRADQALQLADLLAGEESSAFPAVAAVLPPAVRDNAVQPPESGPDTQQIPQDREPIAEFEVITFEDNKWGFRITPPGTRWKAVEGPFPDPVRYSMEYYGGESAQGRANLQVSAAAVDTRLIGGSLAKMIQSSKQRLSDSGARIVSEKELVVGGVPAVELVVVRGRLMQTMTTMLIDGKVYVVIGTDIMQSFENTYTEFQKAVESFEVF